MPKQKRRGKRQNATGKYIKLQYTIIIEGVHARTE